MATITQTFPDFATALAACGRGYNDSDIADVIAYKTALPVDNRQFVPEQALNSIVAVGIAAAEINSRPLTVLDFGGGCGFHFLRLASVIRAPMRWAIVETPTMAERAASAGRGRFEIFTDIAAAASALGPIDLVHASSAIQYVPDPLAVLRALTALRPRYFALLRFPVWGVAQTVGVQTSPLSANGIGPMPPHIVDRLISYPITFVNFDEMMRALNNYEIAVVMPSPSSTYEIHGQRVLGISLIFRLRANAPSGETKTG